MKAKPTQKPDHTHDRTRGGSSPTPQGKAQARAGDDEPPEGPIKQQDLRRPGGRAAGASAGGPVPKPTALAVRPVGPSAIGRVTSEVVDSAREFMAAALSDNTRRAYKSDWKAFALWCAENELVSMPATPATLVLYLTTLASAGKKVATIERAKSSISVAHDTANEKNSVRSTEVKRAMQGIANTLGVAPEKKKAVQGAEVQALLKATKKDRSPARGARDAALLAIGFAGGFRRSELAAICVEHLNFDANPRGGKRVAVFVPKSKTDQTGKGRWVGIAHAPAVDLLRKWLDVLDRKAGPVFVEVSRSRPPVFGTKAINGEAVGDVVKKYAHLVGFDATKYAGHSLRRGFVTTAKRNGKSNESIMKQTGHKSVEVFMGYIEETEIFDDNASENLWE